MSSGKEIRTQIRSIQNTQKITKAMEMVAASKMRKAQDRMAAGRPYAEMIRSVVSHVATADLEFRHPYLIDRPDVRKVGFIIISTDRGLCGGLNTNAFKAAANAMREWSDKGVEVEITTIGKKAMSFFRRFGVKIVASAQDLGDQPAMADILGAVNVMLSAYDDNEIQRLFIVENEFINTMTQEPRVSRLLPAEADTDETLAHRFDYIYEPDAEDVINRLMTRYFEAQVFQAVVENVACEMSARMIAMKNATDNAGNMIDELQLAYNKARQAAITQEISEIVGGAAAV
ncbi:MAG: F0F1 ATP synthase subunit gamma [Gammaproteobacteria bacterium]|nr:MAG: F0F1 ATP synthase subunit gamma [Gammaproteobacteria bacterium]